MRCPFCASVEIIVKDSRSIEETNEIRRRRLCEGCNSRFTTYERVQLRKLFVIKRSGLKKPFDRNKIIHSITTAIRKRRIAQEQVERIADKIFGELESSGRSEFYSTVIGEMIMRELVSIDQVAYIRFASVYKDFRQAKDFAKLINKMEEK